MCAHRLRDLGNSYWSKRRRINSAVQSHVDELSELSTASSLEAVQSSDNVHNSSCSLSSHALNSESHVTNSSYNIDNFDSNTGNNMHNTSNIEFDWWSQFSGSVSVSAGVV